MKSKDLRIGNYVNHDGRLINIELKHFQDILLYPNEQRKYAPIPLTEEWLLKFGFDRIEKEFDSGYSLHYQRSLDRFNDFFLMGDFSFGIDEKNDRCSLCFENDVIKHVHTLQNLYFALTGKELTI